MKKFDPDDVSPKPHTKAITDAILDVILAWPVLETSLTYWISLATGLRPSETGILIGTMDTRTKINKLRNLHSHRKDEEATTLLKAISKEHDTHVDARNTIAHAQLMGGSKRSPDEVFFLTSRAVLDRHGFMVVVRVPIADMRAAAQFARGRSKDIRALLKARGLTIE